PKGHPVPIEGALKKVALALVAHHLADTEAGGAFGERGDDALRRDVLTERALEAGHLGQGEDGLSAPEFGVRDWMAHGVLLLDEMTGHRLQVSIAVALVRVDCLLPEPLVFIGPFPIPPAAQTVCERVVLPRTRVDDEHRFADADHLERRARERCGYELGGEDLADVAAGDRRVLPAEDSFVRLVVMECLLG